MLKAMMSATAGSTSDNENNCNLRVTSEALPYSASDTETVETSDNATASGSVVSDDSADVAAAKSL